MTSDDRPDPDQLLKAVMRQEAPAPAGKLSIFFGMAAGVGKTFAMLTAAQVRRADGVDVVIGLVETHSRKETAALLEGLEQIPRRRISYRNAEFLEMDLDALLKRRPRLALVDELAHTNVPGSRHPKRWQDVIELLDAGIDVYTTLNVQHIESRKATVEAIGGMIVRETVPDLILERASSIELVDITPAELLKRLEEGKVYLGDKAEAAAANFFREDRLTALRELALRLTAEKVDSDLHELLATGSGSESWKPAERFMVAVSHSPHSEGLVRSTRRIAFGLGAPWLAVHVDTGEGLSTRDRATLARNLQLVHELGGELVSTADTDIPGALERIARQRHVTQMVVGRPARKLRDRFTGGSILDRLAHRQADFDILVLHAESHGLPRSYEPEEGQRSFRVTPYALACGTVLVVALINAALFPVIGYKAAGFIFLLSVMVVGLFVTFGAVASAALLSALIWDYFFIPPFGTLYIRQPEDVMMVCSYFVAALVTGTLAHRINTRQRLIRQREERTRVLYDLARSLVEKAGIRDAIIAIAERLRPILLGEVDLIPASASGALHAQSVLASEWLQPDKERAVAMWAHEHGTPAGWSTDTLPASAARYVPLRTGTGNGLGVLAFRPDRNRRLTQDEENLLGAVAHQLALLLERERLQGEAQEAERLKESETLLQAVVDSVSHELRTPLTAIAGTASALSAVGGGDDTGYRKQLISELLTMTDRLNRVVGNLLDMSRLSSGVMTLQKDWHDPLDLVSVALGNVEREMAGHEVRTDSDRDLPLIRVDFQLLVQVVANILANAAAYSPTSAPIVVGCHVDGEQLRITVSDSGAGIAPNDLPHIFTKFYRAKGAPKGGVGLGLAIAKAIVEAHGGKLSASNRKPTGAAFEILLPIERQPEIPAETEAP